MEDINTNKLYTLLDPKHSEPFSIHETTDTMYEIHQKLAKLIVEYTAHEKMIAPYESWVTGYAIQTGHMIVTLTTAGRINWIMTEKQFNEEYPVNTNY